MHKISIDLSVDQLLRAENPITSEQLALLIEWIVTLALHGHFNLVECDNVTAIPLVAKLLDCTTPLGR